MLLQEREKRGVARLGRLMELLPRAIAEEVREISRSRPGLAAEMSEVRLRLYGACSLVIGGRGYPLISRVGREQMRSAVAILCEGALYAYRDSIGMGYISAGDGIRVGIVGVAKYEGGSLVGVGEISSLVYRLPAVRCDFGERLYRSWLECGGGNMIVASPPMGGKTTALRSLAEYIGSGRAAKRVAVVDERCEFDPLDYTDATVDLLRGYRREAGIELAVRTMSAEVIIADEILTDGEADAVMTALGSGVTVITSTHAATRDGLIERKCLSRLLSSGAFRLAALITSCGGYDFEIFEIGEAT